MAKIKVAKLTFDYKSVYSFVRVIRSGQRGSFTNEGLKRGAFVYKNWLIRRYLSHGFGNWKPLDDKYRRSKPFNKSRILVLGFQLMNSIEVVRVGRRFAFNVGYMGPKSKRKYRNPTNLKMFNFKWRGGTIQRLAEIHQHGYGKNPKREIIVPPIPTIVKEIRREIEKGKNKDAENSNRGR